ncbi:MAG: hypothetical protein M1569_02940 [Candidatus Marsarchaeota archaeon]|nr:hypothetical protein [Candidatus Marsarchaeota archaeon]MCL5413333.1 hypothetical protein [Candidatus Marsarchaeota archaeon]
MKLQFATIEAIASLIIAVSSMSAAASILNNYQHYYTMSRSNVSASAAAYDLLSQLSQNSTSQQCITNASGAACNFSYYDWIYGIRSIGIISNTSMPQDYSNIYCANESSESMVCVGVSA